MDIRSIWDSALDFANRNETLIELFVFGFGFAESFVFLSFIVPASALFLGLGALQGASGAPFLPLLLAGAAGAFLGDLVTFAIGRRYKNDVSKCWPFSKKPGWLAATRLLFARWGISAIIVGKFVGPLRPVLPLAGGAMRMSWASFAIASFASSFIWAGAFLAPAYYGLNWLTA